MAHNQLPAPSIVKHNRAKLLLADSQLIFLEGLHGLLSEKYDVAAHALNIEDLLLLASRIKPDAIVCDVFIEEQGGRLIMQALQHELRKMKVIFLTMHCEADLVVHAFQSGASGYVVKHASCRELQNALDAVLAGRTYITPHITSDFVGAALSIGAPREAIAAERLTRRQTEVLKLIAQGKTMKEAAAALGISTRTAEAHKYQMMEHIGVRSVPELIQEGIALGIVGMPRSHSPWDESVSSRIVGAK